MGIANDGKLGIANDGSITNNGTIENDGSIENIGTINNSSGTINNKDNGYIDSVQTQEEIDGTFTGSGTFQYIPKLTNSITEINDGKRRMVR